MKNLFLIIAVVLISLPSQINAQSKSKKVITEEFTVHGSCGMCKDRIENAALIKGVKFAEWDKQNQKIKVIYKSSKVSVNDIHKSIAEVGHDTDKVKAKDEVYKKLPACCAYRDGVKVH